jgi:phosphate-selective porin OprO/OprP
MKDLDKETLMGIWDWRKAVGVLICCTAVLSLGGGRAAADDKLLEQLKARLDKMEQQDEENRKLLQRLEKQNDDLRQKLGEVSTPNPYRPTTAGKDVEKEKIEKVIDSFLQDKEAKKKAEEEAKAAQQEEEGSKVGSDLGLTARWNPQQGLWFETKDKSFASHVGFFFQWDTVAWTQNPNLRDSSQIGNLQDGTFFRRIRPLWDGHAWDFAEWNVILALEQIQGSQANGNANINLDEVWAGVYGIPIIGRIRAGHMKVPQGLEGNQWSSSRAMTFLENAAYTEAFYNIFATGVACMNSFFDDGVNGDRMTYQLMGYRDDNPRTNTGNDFGDGEYAVTGRVSALVIDGCEDRHFLHLGLSGTWRKAEKPGANVTGPAVVQFQARPELRDAIGGFGDTANLPGDSSRMVNTGAIQASSASVIGTEFWYNLGPFSLMAEWAVAQMDSAVVPVTVNGTTTNVIGNRTFHGGYATVSYFLTGESRAYDHTYGREGTFYIDRPFTNAWVTRDENGGLSCGPGAWEVAARFSYLNLNDQPIQGGAFWGITLGLNWYLNSNLKVQFNYVHNARWDKTTSGGGTIGGDVDGFGTRMQIQF